MAVNLPLWIVIHCTDYPKSKLADQFLACDGWHKDRDFPLSSLGYYVGYHKVVTGGKLYTARQDGEVGAHCNQQSNGRSMNYQSLGICVGFDGDIEQVDPIEYSILQKQVWAWQDQYGIANDHVVFHRYFATDKTCPGSLLNDAWIALLLKRPTIVTPAEKNGCITPEEKVTLISLFKKLLGIT